MRWWASSAGTTEAVTGGVSAHCLILNSLGLTEIER